MCTVTVKSEFWSQQMSLFPAYTDGSVPANVVPPPEKGMSFTGLDYITSKRCVYVLLSIGCLFLFCFQEGIIFPQVQQQQLCRHGWRTPASNKYPCQLPLKLTMSCRRQQDNLQRSPEALGTTKTASIRKVIVKEVITRRKNVIITMKHRHRNQFISLPATKISM